MHEYSVASELVSVLLEKLAEHPGRITKVFVQKGELRILSDPALRNAFEVLAQGTRLEGAELVIELVPARISCSACGYEGVAEYAENEAFHFAVPILSCPTCEAAITVLSGRELSVYRVTLETPDDDG
ncbi:hydrogenase maturation nickel metallochaperone HypA [Candidatus Bipolaricaulota bacterium]|nr:hydrogenase maturation nickel metallochaperone HypA [Candidatus Bipolaricaulota bacterium]